MGEETVPKRSSQPLLRRSPSRQGRFEEADASLQEARQNGYADWEIVQEQIDSLEAQWQEP